MAIEFENAVLAGVTLVREAIQSQNYVQDAAGWQIKADGSAEFSDLKIRSSDGSGRTVTVDNGRVAVRDADGDVVAELTTQTPSGGAGMVAYEFSQYAALEEGKLIFGRLSGTHTEPEVAGFPGSPSMVLNSGRVNPTDANLRVILNGVAAGGTPYMYVTGDNAARARLEVDGEVIARNVRAGSAQAPAPGAVPGQTTVNVTFSAAMPSVPKVTVTPESASGNLNTSNIRWAITGKSTTGFTVNVWRDTNAATNLDWIAVCGS